MVFIEDKTIVDWELEKKVVNFRPTDKDRSRDTRTHPVGSQKSFDEPDGFGQ